jgi:hypothetical protein
LPSAGGFAERFFRALGKEGFAKSQIKNTRQSLCTRQRRFCRVSNKKHSAKKFAKCRALGKETALGKEAFADRIFAEGALPRAALGKGFAEDLRGFAESLGPSTK